MWSIPFVEWKQLALPTFGCAKSSSSLYISSRASGKGHCGVHCLGASPGQVAGSFLSASQHNYKNCVPRATWWDAGMEEGYVNHHEAARLGSCTHHKTLHPETQRNSMRRNEVNEEWTNSEPVWFSVVVNGVKEMLWNLCLCTTSFPANPAPAVTLGSWFPGSFSSCCSQLQCLLQSPRPESTYTYQSTGLSRDTPSVHCNTKMYQAEHGRPTVFGITYLAFPSFCVFSF